MPSISIKQGFKTYYLNWEIIHQDKRCMRIKVTPQSNPSKYIILENNGPLIRGKYKLKNRRIDWKLVEGDMRKSAMEMIIEAIVNPPVPEKKVTVFKPSGPVKPNKGESPGLPLGERNK
jgi:hypothetical protein